MNSPKKLIRITTVPLSLQTLIAGQMQYMSQNGFEVSMISSDFDDKKQLAEKENAVFIPVDMTRTISPWADLKALFRLIKVFKKLKPIIVHSHTPKAGLLSMLAGKITGVPIRLHTVAGLPLMESRGSKRRLLEFVEKVAYRCATKVYPNSMKLQDFILQSKFCGAEKLKVIGSGSSNGIDSSYFQRTAAIAEKARAIKKNLKLSSKEFVFIYVGRLVRAKGVEELVKAFKNLQQKHPQAILILLGPEEGALDPLSPQTLQEIQNNRAIVRKEFEADIRPYLSLSHVLVLASYREGFPNVPMQAGCFNLPCIVTDINGSNEIIKAGENGLIIPVKDSKSLEFAMERLLQDKLLYQKLAGNARRLIVERFEQQQIWELLLAEYQEHLKNHEERHQQNQKVVQQNNNNNKGPQNNNDHQQNDQKTQQSNSQKVNNNDHQQSNLNNNQSNNAKQSNNKPHQQNQSNHKKNLKPNNRVQGSL
ncbi:glycosyltransferase family 4 protein [Pedobacter sp.]|uniref:glycosyltransferase family 4 protein n=1 Tax=Pedobacter sp. TaxID=1411316 RepID=UPI003D7F7B04